MVELRRSENRWLGIPVASGGSVALHALFLVGFIAAGNIRIESLDEPQMKSPVVRGFVLPAAAAAGYPLPRGRQAAQRQRAREPEGVPRTEQPQAPPDDSPPNRRTSRWRDQAYRRRREVSTSDPRRAWEEE